MEYKDPTILPLEKEQEHLAFIQKQVLAHPVVKVHHGKWKELIEWENGNQFSIWDETAQGMVAVQLKRRKKKVVINLMKPLAEAIEGKLNFTAQFEGVPNSSELRDISGAQVATKLVAHNDYMNDMEALNEDLKYDLIRTGNAFRKWTWETGRFGYIENSKGEKIKEEGELVGCVPSVFNIRLDPTARGTDDARWIIEIEEVTEDAICETFGIKPDDIRASQDGAPKAGAGVDSLKFKGMNERAEEKDKEEPTHIVAWYWERTSPAYPEGRHIISIPGMILWAKQNPALGKIPFFKYGYKRHGSSPWFTGPLHHVQDIQRDFNRMVSIVSEHVEGWRAKIVIDKNAGLKEGSFTADSFEILEIDRSKGDPIPVTMPLLSPEVMNHRDFLVASMDRVSNVHEVSYSQLPERASRAPASLFAMMVEQENMKIDPMIRRHNRTLKREVQFRLEMMGHYYKNPRMVKIIGVNERSTIAYFSGSKMEGNYDVKLVIGVSIHQSKTIQQRMMLDLKQAGAPIEWNTIFKLLWEGDISEKIRGDIADEQRASRENQCFLENTFKKAFKDGGVLILVWDNHVVHLDIHMKLAKTEEAQRWDDERSAAMNVHILKHMGMLKKQMQAAAAQAAVVQGATVGAGAGGGKAAGGGGQATDETQATEDSLPF